MTLVTVVTPATLPFKLHGPLAIAAEAMVNCAFIRQVLVLEHYIRVELEPCEHENFVDAGSMMSFLAKLKTWKLVGASTQTMWVGANNSQGKTGRTGEVIWCRR